MGKPGLVHPPMFCGEMFSRRASKVLENEEFESTSASQSLSTTYSMDEWRETDSDVPMRTRSTVRTSYLLEDGSKSGGVSSWCAHHRMKTRQHQLIDFLLLIIMSQSCNVTNGWSYDNLSPQALTFSPAPSHPLSTQPSS